ncbi:MAG: hypothetical protein II943_00560 [Victivallales bacterium]|nr:hypothetical protein [Victivallales bacterium]
MAKTICLSLYANQEEASQLRALCRKLERRTKSDCLRFLISEAYHHHFSAAQCESASPATSNPQQK